MTLNELNLKTAHLILETNYGEEITSSGMAGDQIGYETHARSYYTPERGNKWGKVYRILGKDGVEDRSIADKIASSMEASICNGYVGYDGTSRNTFLAALEKNSFNFSGVNESCNTDCSALVYAALRSATGYLYDVQETSWSPFRPSGSPPSPVVRNFDYIMENQLPSLGFMVQVFTIPTTDDLWFSTPYDEYGLSIENLEVNNDNAYSNYLTNPNNWLRGDIIRTNVTTYTDRSNTGHIIVWG